MWKITTTRPDANSSPSLGWSGSRTGLHQYHREMMAFWTVVVLALLALTQADVVLKVNTTLIGDGDWVEVQQCCHLKRLQV